MKAIFGFVKKHKYLLLLLLISAVVYFRWLSFHHFAYGDNHYFYLEKLRDALLPKTWLSDHTPGHFDLEIWKYPYRVIPALLAIFAVSYNISGKLVLMWPVIFLLPLSGYLIVHKITNNKLSAFVGAIVFSFNSYFLAIDSQGHLPLTIASAFANIALYFFICSLESQKMNKILLTALFLFMTASYDLRFVYIIWWVFLLYSAYFIFFENKFGLKNLIKALNSFGLSFLLFLLLSAFWLLPQFLAGELTQNAVLNRDLIYVNYWGITQAIALFHPYWSSTPAWQKTQLIPSYMALIPTFAFLGFYLNKQNKKVLFFTLLSIIGILFSKQNGSPFEGFYEWMFKHVLGFSAFREATKFYYIIALGYSVLIGFFISWLWAGYKTQSRFSRYLRLALTCLVIGIFLFNTLSIISGKKASLYTPKEFPQDYLILKNYLKTEDAFSFRTFLVPRDSRWFPNYDEFPKFDLTRTVEEKWATLRGYNKNPDHPYVDILEQDFSQNLLRNYSVKYLVIPIDAGEDFKNDFSVHFNKDRDFYTNILTSLPYLEKLDIGTKELLIYKTKDYKPRLYTTLEPESIYKNLKIGAVKYQELSTTKIRVRLDHVKETVYLNFTDSFHSGWQLKLKDANWLASIISEKNTYDPSLHLQSDSSLNSYAIDPLYIKNIYPKDSYDQNADGSINLDLYLYFKPQSYAFLGTAITGTVLFAMLILFYVNWRKKRL